ncbi:MAG: sulfite reductase, dissimilatory-type beta subunit, partial [Pseudomonadota bacterium]
MRATKMAPRDQGAPDYTQYLHPMMAKNYGKWDSHDRLRPGVLCHTAENGDKLYTVRAGSARTMSPHKIRQICDVADRFCKGYLRFTIRANIEFLLDKEDDLDPLIDAVENELGLPVGG